MTMSGENKHNSFFTPEDSPIPVPPAEDAWSLMRQRLDTGMPIMKVKASWLRSLRWLAPAAGVAGVTILLVVHKPLRQDIGRVVGEKVSVGTKKGETRGPEVGGKGGARSGAAGEIGTDAKALAPEGAGEHGRATGASGTEAGEGSGLKPGEGEDSVKRRGSEIVITDRRGGRQAGSGSTAERSGGEIAGSEGTAKTSGGGTTGSGARISGKGKGRQRGSEGLREGSRGSRGRSEGSRGPVGQNEGANGQEGKAAGKQQGEDIQHERGHLHNEREHPRHEGKAQIPPLAFIGSGYDRSSPGSYASLPVAGFKGGKSLLPGKALPAKGGKGAIEDNGEQILAFGVWDGLNFAMGDQTVYRYTSSDGPDLLVDHLPGAYVRMYLGDRVYIDAGVRLYSPQYTRLQQIDSTGGPDTTYNPYQSTFKDTVISLEKLYYTDIPLTVHYRVAAGLYLGGGLQYSRLWDGAAVQRFDSRPFNGSSAVSSSGNWNLDLKYDAGALARLRRSDWRVLLDVAYRWRRVTLDLRYQQSLTSYVRPGQGGSSPRNSSLQLNLSYDIWRQRRKK
jgi:hypothetical protein